MTRLGLHGRIWLGKPWPIRYGAGRLAMGAGTDGFAGSRSEGSSSRMLVVIVPGAEAMLAIQEREQAFYYSAAAEGVLRREGLVSTMAVEPERIATASAQPAYVFTRDATVHPAVLEFVKTRPLAFEGPLSNSVLEWLGLEADVVQVDGLTVRATDGSASWSIMRPRVSIGAVPRNVTLPRMWTNPAIAVQVFRGNFESVSFEMILPDGRKAPAVFRHKGVWVAALPVFDLVAQHFTCPPLTDRYYTRQRFARLNEFQAAVVSDLAACVTTAGDVVQVRCERWPDGYGSAFTIRNDNDRLIGDADHAALLELYDRLALKCSIGYLGYLLPARQIREFARRGHEIQLHAYQASAEEFAASVARLRDFCGGPVEGATVHGGDSGIGFRGDMHFDWAERAGLSYIETFSVDDYPSPIYRPDPLGLMRRSRLVGSMMHHSLDVSTTPGAHRLGHVREKVSTGLANGRGVIAMNHPDLNRGELIQLLETMPRDGVWCATLGEICGWERVTKYDATVVAQDRSLTIQFDRPLTQAAAYRVRRRGGAEQRLVIPAGSWGAVLDQADGVKIIVKPPSPLSPPGLRRFASVRRALRGGLRLGARQLSRAKRLAQHTLGRLRPRPEAMVISRTANRVQTDALVAGVREAARVVLQHAKPEAGELDFVKLIAQAGPWPRQQPVIGQSVAHDLHPTMVEAIALILARQTAAEVRDGRTVQRRALPAASDKGRILADWILRWAKRAAEGDASLQSGELVYFIASTSFRARALANVIDTLGPPTIGCLVDHGTAIGLAPWLLGCGDKRVERAVLVEPATRYFVPMQDLWSIAGDIPVPTYEWRKTGSEGFVYGEPADVILFCHALFRIAPHERAAVLARAWNALRPGGLLLVNEIVTDEDEPAGTPRLMRRSELIEVMSWQGTPQLFLADSDWREAIDPMSRTVREIGSAGVFVARKDAHSTVTATAVPVALDTVQRDPVDSRGWEVLLKQQFMPQGLDRAALTGFEDALVRQVGADLASCLASGRLVVVDAGAVDQTCGRRCPDHVTAWAGWFTDRFGGLRLPGQGPAKGIGVANAPLALLPVDRAAEEYHKAIGPEARSLIAEAQRAGFTVRRFSSRDHPDDMHAIDLSLPEGGGLPMGEGCRVSPTRSDPGPGDYCSHHDAVSVGCFRGDTLVAYCRIAVLGELAIGDPILAHGEHLPNGVINLLVDGMAAILHTDFPKLRALTMPSSVAGIDDFRRSVGFRDTAVVLKAPGLGGCDFRSWARVAGPSPAMVGGPPFDPAHFEGKGLDGLVPAVPDHSGSGLAAILRHLHLPRDSRVLDVSAHGRSAAGAATPDLLMEMVDGPLDILDTDREAVDLLAARFGARARLHHGDFETFQPPAPLDLIVLDLSSTVMATRFEPLLAQARNRLGAHGQLICFFTYDVEQAYGGPKPILNPADRGLQARFLRCWFGDTSVGLEAVRPVLWPKGFAALSLVDRWMGSAGRLGIGWLHLEKREAPVPG